MTIPTRKLTFLTSAALIAGVALLSDSCSRTPKVEARAKASDAPAVAVAKATIENLSRGLILTAEFKPFQEVDLMAKVAGYVKNIKVDVGDRVKEGQLLAILEIPEMADDRARAQAGVDRSQAEVARAKDQVQQAQSAHEIAHLSYTRLAEVSKQKPGLIAQQEIDDARGKDLVAEAQISGARSNLAAAEEQVHVNAAELQKIKTLFDYTRVTAPFAGVVTKRYADTGSLIQAGTAANAMPLVKLSENSLLRLILPVPESAVPTVRVGQHVEVRVQRQVEAYNAHDLGSFIAQYADDVQVFRPPSTEPVLSGKAAFAAHYANKRFNLPNLHAAVINRMIVGNRVVDHERITGVEPGIVEAIAVYEVKGELIERVWFF